MTQIAFEATIFIIIAANFIVCVIAVILPWLKEAFRKHPKHEAVIIPFARQERRGGRHV
ncbi:hypothetical protein [Rhizobium lusitanum]|uniref:Uncharacterized protein n=1 Tax=Rhizobium lusitanum TaxID=293958 RepID=A0A1C3VS34_9HYPH|nr:hypothetical protein [Rhizobium lusitanum]SCB30509.1 hypothetical protein GA0061101_106118 [Rhizobium lusitanum]